MQNNTSGYGLESNPFLKNSSLSTLTVSDFYCNPAMELGAQPAFRKPDNFRIIQEEICRLALEKQT